LATFCSPYPIEIEDQNVYIVTQVGKDKALVQKVDAGIIESGTGLLVEGSGTVNIAYAYGEKGNALSGNMLVGTLKEKDLAKGEAYILKDGAFHLSNAGTFPARKAYLPVDAASSAKLFIDFSGTTAINEVKAQNESSEIYTIGGIRVKNAQQKGVYIINGKKVVK
jgi:predicted RecA/RadA family phage recombinase